MKKLLSLFLCVALICSLSIPASAVHSADSIEATEKINSNQFEASVSVLSSIGETAQSLIPNSIDYTYSHESINHIKGTTSVTLQMELHYPEYVSSCTVIGDARVYPLSNDKQYLTGVLKGTVGIGDGTYSVMAGFQKFDCDENVNVALTIFDSDNEVIIKFGKLIVPYEEVKEVLLTDMSNITDAVNDGNFSDVELYAPRTTEDYSYVHSKYGKTAGVEAIKQTVYYNQEYQRVLVNVCPRINNIESLHNNVSSGNVVAAYVDHIDIDIIEHTNTDATIQGLVLGRTNPMPSNGGTIYGQDAVTSIIDFLSLILESDELALISSVLQQAIGSGAPIFTVSSGTDSRYADYSYLGSDDSLDSYGVSFAIELNPVSGKTAPLYGRYDISSAIEYRVAVTDSMGDVSSIARSSSVSCDHDFYIPT